MNDTATLEISLEPGVPDKHDYIQHGAHDEAVNKFINKLFIIYYFN